MSCRSGGHYSKGCILNVREIHGGTEVQPTGILLKFKDIGKEDCAQVGLKDAAVILIFGLEAIFTRVFKAHTCAVSSRPQMLGCYWYLQQSNQLLLALIVIKPVLILTSLLCEPWKNTVLLKCHHPYSLAQSSYIMSLAKNQVISS